MNSLLRITIEIAVKQAQELAALVKTIEGLRAKGKSSASGLKAVADAVKQTAKQAKGVEEAQKKVLANQKAIEAASRTIIGNMKNVVEQFKRNMISAEEAAKRVEALGAKRRDPKGRFMAQTPDVLDAQRKQLDAIARIARQKIREEEAEKILSIKRILAQEETGRIRSFAARRAISKLGEGAAPGSAVDIQKARAYRALDAREIARTSKVQRDDQKRLEASIRSMKTEMSNAMKEFNNGLIDAEAASKRIKGIWQKSNGDPSIQNKIAQGGEVSRQAKINLAKIESARIKAIKKDEIDYLNKISREYANGQITYSQMVTRTRYNAGASGNPEVRAAAEANIQKASIDRLKAFTQQAAGIEARFRQQKISFTDAQAQIAKVRQGIDNTYTTNSIKQAQARTRASDALNAINIRNEKSATDQLRKIEQDFIKGKVSYQKSLLAAGAIKTGLNSTPAIKKAADQSMLNLTQAREVKIHSSTVKQIEDIRRKHYSKLISFAQANSEINKIEKNYLNSGLSAQKIADDLSIARLKMRNTEERRLVARHMEELLLIRKRAAVGQISMTEAQKQVSAIGSMHPAGSKVNVQAASEYKRIGDAMKRATDAGSALNGSLTTQRRSLIDVGKNMMWTGRQLEYTFTLPMVRAGKAIYRMQIASEKATTRIAKVYGDASGAADSFNTAQYRLGKTMSEVSASQQTDSYKLGKGFRLLSDGMGVQIDQVEQIAAQWAAAGYQGGGLLKATRMTMEAMKVGDIENVDNAFKALIQTKEGYKLSLEGTTRALAVLNKTENITAANFTDLTDGFARSASAASQAGIKVEELAGMLATLVPAAGSAETVGQGIKTLISRVMSPTQAFIEDLAQVGIVWNDTFGSMTGTQRLTTLAARFMELDDAQREQLQTTFAGRYQLNRSSLLFKDLALAANEATRSQSTFAKVVDATSGTMEGGGDAMKTYKDEIATMLASTPGQIDIVKTKIKNIGNDIFAQMLPVILRVLVVIQMIAAAINGLSDRSKKMLIVGLMFLGILGPVARILGSFMQIGQAFQWISGGFKALISSTKAAIGVTKGLIVAENAAAASGAAAGAAPILGYIALAAAIVAVIALLWVFRDDIYKAIKPAIDWTIKAFQSVGKFIVRVFNALPGPVKNALLTLFRIVSSAVMAIVNVLKNLNPFQRHSPSLVDNVTAGVTEIARQYARLSGIGNIYAEAAAKLREFGEATKSISQGAIGVKRDKQREQIGSQQPQLMPAVESLWVSMDQLSAAMESVQIEIDAQSKVVAGLEAEYKRLGRALDDAEFKLKRLEETSSSLKEQMEAAKSELSDWANRPIQGSKQLSDALFENEMAQKRLRLEIMRIEDTYGSIDDVKNKMALLAGEIEQLQALQTNLRESGAGSEITDPIQQKIAQLRAESAALASGTGGSQISKLEEELKRLQREAERLDLQGAIQFDPMKRQIEELANATREATFEEIIAGMAAARVKIDELTPRLSEAEAAAKTQRDAVNILKTAHEDLGFTLDVEKGKLDDLQGAYDGIKSLYDDINGAIESVISDLEAMSDAAGAAGGAMDELATGDWKEDFKIDPEDMNIDEVLQGIMDDFENSIRNMFGPWKARWNEFKVYATNALDFVKDHWLVFVGVFLGPIGVMIAGIYLIVRAILFVKDNWRDVFDWILDKMTEAGDGIGDVVERIGKFFTDDIPAALDWMWEKFKHVLLDVIPNLLGQFVGFVITLPVILYRIAVDAGMQLWNGLKLGVEWILRKVPEAFGDLKELLIDSIRGVADFFTKAWDGIVLAIVNFPATIGGIVTAVGDAAVSIGKALWNGITSAFGYMGDVFSSIGGFMKGVWNSLVGGLERALNSFLQGLGSKLSAIGINVPNVDLSGWKMSVDYGSDPTYGASPFGLHTGGIVPGVIGSDVPTVLQAGEGVLSIKMMRLIDRAISAPEQSMTSNSSSSKTINFYGDLSFPNISNSDDAEQFIRNLEAMAAS